MRIGSYNVRLFGNNNNWITRIPALYNIAKVIKSNKLDAICIQGGPSYATLSGILMYLGGYNCISTKISKASKGRCAIMYKTKSMKLLNEPENLVIESKDKNGKLQKFTCRGIFKLKDTGETVEIVSVDLSSYSDSGKRDALALIKENFDFLNTYVAGSFDVSYGNILYKNFMQKLIVLANCNKKLDPVEMSPEDDIIFTQKSVAKNVSFTYVPSKYTNRKLIFIDKK